MQLDDDTRLHHMLDAARVADAFVRGKTRQDLEENRQLALSLVKCIEIIGEAASKVTEEARSANQEIPWRVIVAMRNRLDSRVLRC